MESLFLYDQQQQQQKIILDPDFFSNSPINEIPDHLSNNTSSSCFPTYQSSLNEIKRKQISDVGSSLSTTTCQSRENNKSRRKKQCTKMEKKEEATNVGPTPGYIHVRARRGQATDSHSLAERVRREKISERMKKLQGLVPGCDKVIGKALVLDEIINYIQCLQNQAEFLSMKLAFVNPMCMDYEDYRNQTEEQIESISQTLPSSIIQSNHIISPSNNSLQQHMIDPAASSLPPPFFQGNCSKFSNASP